MNDGIVEVIGLFRSFLREALAQMATHPGTEMRHLVNRGGNGINISRYERRPLEQLFVNVVAEQPELTSALYDAVLKSMPAKRYFLSRTNGSEGFAEGAFAEGQFNLAVQAIVFHYFFLTSGSETWSEKHFDELAGRLAVEIAKPTVTRLRSIYLINVNTPGLMQLSNGLAIRPVEDREISVRLDHLVSFHDNLDARSLLYCSSVIEQRAEVPFSQGQIFQFEDLTDRIEAAIRIVTGGTGGVLKVEDTMASLAFLGFWGPIRQPEVTALARPTVHLAETDAIAIANFMKRTEESPNAKNVEIAWRRLNFGVSRERPEDSILDFVIGIESVLNVDRGAEAKRKICQRLSALIGGADEREDIYLGMRRLYDRRSDVSHGSAHQTAVAESQQARDYLSRLVLSVLALLSPLKMPDLDNAIVRGLGARPYAN